MKYVVDAKSRTPAYQQLYLQVREDIVKNEEKIESKDDFENAFEPKQKNSRFSNRL